MSSINENKKNKQQNLKVKLENVDKTTSQVLDKIIDERVEPRKYTRGPLRFMSAKSLSRGPVNIKNNPFLLLIFGIAILLCIIVLLVATFSSVGNNIMDFGSTEANISRQVNYQIPQVASYLGLDKVQVEELMSESGFTYAEMPNTNQNSTTYDLFKLPSDVDPMRANDWLSRGFSKMGSANAAMLMRGGWQFSADAEATNFARVRYTDFDSTDEKAAIDSALTTQAFADNYVTNDDVDELGNTYKAGTAKYNDIKISWRISAIKLKEVYDIGMPDNSIYVGIRVELM